MIRRFDAERGEGWVNVESAHGFGPAEPSPYSRGPTPRRLRRYVLLAVQCICTNKHTEETVLDCQPDTSTPDGRKEIRGASLQIYSARDLDSWANVWTGVNFRWFFYERYFFPKRDFF